MRATVRNAVTFADTSVPLDHAVDVRTPADWAPKPGDAVHGLWNALAISTIYDSVAQAAPDRIAVEAPVRLPRRDVPIILYDGGEGLAAPARAALTALGYTDVRALAGGLQGWRDAGYELFEDVNSYSKAFGELVEHRRHTPAFAAQEVQALIDEEADIAILDARRFDEYATMSVPGGTSVSGAELVLRARAVAPDPATTIIVNCAGRTRSIIGAQSLINAGLPNPVRALRNGTIGWTLAGQALDRGQHRRAPIAAETVGEALRSARDVAYRAGVKRITPTSLARLIADAARTLYRFDVRQPEDYAAGHIPGFRNAPGGQLVQETDHFVPVRGARIVLADDLGPRADMTASWLAQLGWKVYVLDGGFDGPLEQGAGVEPPPRAARTAVTSAPTKAPTMRPPRCRLISTGNMASSRSWRAMAPTVSSSSDLRFFKEYWPCS